MGYNSKFSKSYKKWDQLYNSGMSLREIAIIYNCDKRNIGKRLKDYGTKLRLGSQPVLENPYLKFVIKNDSGCWGWSGKINNKGYGQFNFESKAWLSHRYSYFIHRGDIGDYSVCHSCDNPICTNPDHLFLGTHTDNMRDCRNKNRNRSFKLTISDVKNIKKELEHNVINITLKEFAKKHNISISHLRRIRRGQVWGDI